MDLFLQDKVVIITGGARGIGEGISRTLAAEGAMAVIVGRHAEENLAAVAAINGAGGRADSIVAELSRPQECADAVAQVLRRHERIDGLVNNAGVNDGVSLAQGSYQQFVDSLHGNLIHYFLMAQHCLPELKRQRGAIVNISSKTAETGQGGTSAYAAANGGRNALTREWAVELLEHGVRVNAVVVAECFTPLYAQWIERFSDPQAALQQIGDRIPLGRRMTTANEIANTVAFLLSARSSHTTGQLVHVDGGYVHLDRAA